MRISLGLPLILASFTTAQLVPPLLSQQKQQQLALHDQAVTDMPGRSLADCLTVERSLSLFYEYAREVPSVMSSLTSSTERTTILAPSDQAIIALPRKPHQDRESGVPHIEIGELSPQAADERATSNVERFVNAHVLASHHAHPPPLDKSLPTRLDGLSITFRADASARAGLRVDPGDVEVLRVDEVKNGRVYYLGGIVNY